MAINQTWRLRELLYFLTAAIVLPAAVLLLYSAHSQYRQAEQAAAEQAFNLARIAANNTESFLSNAEQLLKTLSVRIQSRKNSVAGCDPVFSEFRDLNPEFANLSQSNPEGFIECSSLPQVGNTPTYIGGTVWYERVYLQKKLVLAPPYVGPVSGKLVSVIAYPILDKEGEMQGALQLPIDLVNFELVPGMKDLPQHITISVFDSSGTLIIRSKEQEKFIGKNLLHVDGVQLFLKRKQGTEKTVSSEGVERIYGFLPIAGTDWIAVAGISTEVVLAAARQTAKTNLMVGLGTLLVISIFAFYISSLISRPILNMQTTARRVSEGRHDERVPVSGPAEIAEVSTQFNAMLDAIERSNAEQAARENQIYRLGFYDFLTELPNRRLLTDIMDHAIERAVSHSETGAVIYIDLDHFKDINDVYGHQSGDHYLKQVGDRLRGIAGQNDTVARLGSDEFVFIAVNLATDLEGARLAARILGEKIQNALNRPFNLEGRISTSSASVGITFYPKSGDTSDVLLHESDIAMYCAKAAGRNQVHFFEPSMREEISARLSMEADLKLAIKAGALSMYIQPQFDHAGLTVGAEMLLRWNDPVRGPVSPAEFIPLAEKTDLILQLGDWVLERACETLSRMQTLGVLTPISINVSPRQFRHSGFVEKVRRMVNKANIPASLLIFEVTEGLLIDDLDSIVERMNQLSSLGIRFSIDDFGTGYSSLAYLKRLPLYELKIDKSFIRDTPAVASDTAIVHSILDMAKHLGLQVVAEGVETKAQADFLSTHGCNAMQGYLFARPMPVQEWLKQVEGVT